MITKLEELIPAVQAKGKKRLVAAYANDAHTIEAVHDAVRLNIVEATLIGDIPTIKSVCAEHQIDPRDFSLIQEDTDVKCVSLL